MASASSTPSLEFQFWDDHLWLPYGPHTQRELRKWFLAPKRPDITDRLPPDYKYRIDSFGQVEKGYAVQVNVHSKFARPVRMKPPYCLPGHDSPKLPDGKTFIFEVSTDDVNWYPYPFELQEELRLAAQSAPLPERVFFAEAGCGFYLLGFDSLGASAVPGESAELTEINKRTHDHRRVRVYLGQPPAASKGGGTQLQALSSGCAAAASSFARCASAFKRRSQAGRRGNAFSLLQEERSFSLQQAAFFWGDNFAGEQVPKAFADALLKQWRREPRPSRVEIQGVQIINFGNLEVGGAGSQQPVALGPAAMSPSHRQATWRPLRVRLPAPQAGRVVLPEGLDAAADVELSACARLLDDREIAALAARGADARQCAICLLDMEGRKPGGGATAADDEVCELKCGHIYHAACLSQWFKNKQRCPQCQTQFGKVIGQQPLVGTLSWHTENFSLPGHEDSRETIIVQFDFPPGVDENGTRYQGRQPKCYLPCNAQGIILLELFKVAFRRRVMFGLGNSATFSTFRPTFNIHIKTSTHRGATGHGYPDPDYFARALDELRANGVTCQDLP